ncbi:MAG TPA: H(+)-transporting ATPase, partial [Verrucomicrobiales bacterium]|nr:H(+)-transporting ATPase [Verrucomicrobiales bacterium]
MKSGKAALKTARQLFRLCFKEGSLDGVTVLKVVRRYGEDKPRGYLGILSSFQRLIRLEVEKSRC